MKKQILFLLLYCSCLFSLPFGEGWGGVVSAQGGTWVWLKGSNSTGAGAVFGTQGVANPANTPPSLYEAANWIDQQGNFWIFGGLWGVKETSDLWKYDPVNNLWTWIKGPGITQQIGTYGTRGVPALANNPGARAWGADSWTDNNGDLWLWGGFGFDSAGTDNYLNDLWRYHIATNEWTWFGGSKQVLAPDVYGSLGVASLNNTPSARGESAGGWTDNNNGLWFFGGFLSTGEYNDLWKYDVSTNEWTWMKGPQGTGNAGNYGSEGVETASNLPIPRGSFTRWKDASGNFYLWAGMSTPLSDVWKYNYATNNWIWVAGDSSSALGGNYNTYCTNNGKTGPMARYENRTAQVLGCVNVFYTFGGIEVGQLNDLWSFNPQTNNWKWLSGTNNPNDPGSYGTLGMPAPTNLPPARCGHCMWVDNNGALWMFGGMQTGAAKCNDVWKFVPDTTCMGAIICNAPASPLQVQVVSWTGACAGSCNGTITVAASGGLPPYVYQWVGTGVTGPTIDSLCPGSYIAHVSDAGGATLEDTIFIPVIDPLPCNITSSANVFCMGDSVQICSTSPWFVSYNWSTGDTGSCVYITQSGAYHVTATDNSGCTISSNAVTVQVSLLQIHLSAGSILCNGDSSTVTITASGGTTPYSGTGTFTVHAGTYHYMITDSAGCTSADSIIVAQPPPLQVTAIADTNAICANDSAQICATAGFASYNWNNGASSMCIYTQAAGNYYLTVTDNNGCTAESNHIAITVHSPPPVSISVNGDTLTSYNAVTYQWYLNGNIIPGATGQTYIATQGGSYTVQVTDTNGCGAVSTSVIISDISPVLSEGESAVAVYPNPNSVSNWQLAVGKEFLKAKVEVFDADGRLILMSNIEHPISNLELNVSGGIYLLRISSTKNVIIRKLIKL